MYFFYFFLLSCFSILLYILYVCRYPFYGVQFHPEKNAYEFIENRNISHTSRSIRAAQYFANFFIDESRYNENRFTNKTEEASHLIYNYSPVYTGLVGSSFVQQYLFEENGL